MSTNQKSLHFTTNLKTSSALAAKLAHHIQKPQLIELVGDLGGGKTAFTKALGKSLGVAQTITSPTFSIHRGYDFADGRLEHFDLYRLSDDEVVLNELQDCLSDQNSIVVVEWAANFQNTLASDRLVLEFHYVDDSTREIIVTAIGAKSQKLLESLE